MSRMLTLHSQSFLFVGISDYDPPGLVVVLSKL